VIPPWCCDLDDNPYCSLPIFIIITTQSVSSATANAASAAVMNTRTKATGASKHSQHYIVVLYFLFYSEFIIVRISKRTAVKTLS